MKPTFRVKPVLTGALVELRPVRVADADGLYATHPETLRLTGTHRELSLDWVKDWYSTRAGQDDRIDLAIIERSTGEWAGEVVLNDLDSDNLSCGFRIMLAQPRFFGRGLGTEATRLMLAHAFGTVGLHRVELEVFTFNPRARHVYTKCGFVYEGTRRDALRWDGEWVDAEVMAVLASDWANVSG
jgi:RimJ/RimL family protein N-acetyltransferase